LLCTIRSTVAFFTLFFTLDMAFLMLGIAYLTHAGGEPNSACLKAGGVFGILAAFTAWYALPRTPRLPSRKKTSGLMEIFSQGTTPWPVSPTRVTLSSSFGKSSPLPPSLP